MAFKEVLLLLNICFLHLGGATSCTFNLTVDFQRRAVQMGSVDNVAPSVPTIGSAVRENAARVPVARRNVQTAAAEKIVTTARTVRSVILESAVTRIIPARAFVLILASLGQPLEALSLAVWFSLPL